MSLAVSPYERTPSPEERAEFDTHTRRSSDSPWRNSVFGILGALLVASVSFVSKTMWDDASKLDRLGDKVSVVNDRQDHQEVRMNNIDANVVRLCVKSGVEPVR